MSERVATLQLEKAALRRLLEIEYDKITRYGRLQANELHSIWNRGYGFEYDNIVQLIANIKRIDEELERTAD